MSEHANIETFFVTLQRIVTKQLGSDLFVHFKCVKVLSQTTAYKYGAFPSQPISEDGEAKLPSDIFNSKPAHLPTPLLLPGGAGRSD